MKYSSVISNCQSAEKSDSNLINGHKPRPEADKFRLWKGVSTVASTSTPCRLAGRGFIFVAMIASLSSFWAMAPSIFAVRLGVFSSRVDLGQFRQFQRFSTLYSGVVPCWKYLCRHSHFTRIPWTTPLVSWLDNIRTTSPSTLEAAVKTTQGGLDFDIIKLLNGSFDDHLLSHPFR